MKKIKYKNRSKKYMAIKIVAGILIFLLLAYVVLVYFVVSAALVPAFMEKLDAFEDITVQSYAAMVQTDDIHENQRKSREHMKVWLEDVDTCKVELTNKDGFRLVAQEFAPEIPNHRWVLLLHGYTGWKEELFEIACWYQERGYHCLVPDLRCQGESQGDFIGMGWTDHQDCLEWLDYILNKDPQAEIVLHGQSMGAATALMMTGDKKLPKQVKAAISDCAYTDAYSMFADKAEKWLHLPAFPLVDSARWMLLARGGYDLMDASAINAVERSTTPTLFIHGDQDAMISVSCAYDLFELAACNKQLLIVEGAGHVQSDYKSPELYYGTIEAWLASCYNS